MEDDENSGGGYSGDYKKLISQEDSSADEPSVCPDQEKRQVIVSMVRPEAGLNHNKLIAVCLAVLAVILLAIDIGLGVYYNKLTGGQRTIRDINGELAKLQSSYDSAVLRRDEASKALATEISNQQFEKWQTEHLTKRQKDYKQQSEKIRADIAVLKSHMPMIEEGCRRCLSGWTFMNSVCYYFPLSDDISRRPWSKARQFCTRHGADLAVVDTREKHLAVNELINNYKNPSRQISHNGYWIGLRDVEDEGTWKWLDGTRLSEGYWNDGEPNNQGNEDCAATYPRGNPFTAWNDAPCTHDLKWICEMAEKPLGLQ